MDDHAAVGPAREAGPPGAAGGQGELAHGGGGRERAQPERDQRLDAAYAQGDAHDDGRHRRSRRPLQTVAEQLGGCLAPRQRGGHGHQEQQGEDDGLGHGVEVGPAHGDALAVHRLRQQREHRPQQDDEGEGGEEEVVAQEGALPGDGRVDGPG